MRTEASVPRWLIWMSTTSNTSFGDRYDVIAPWFMRIYRILGGRPTFVDANVRIRDNRMWGADYDFATWAYPGTGRNDGQPYFVFAGVNFGSRLIPNQMYMSPGAIKQGFQTELVLNCLGCESVSASITPQTPSDEIRRFNQFNFDCITRIRTCHHPSDLAPALTETATHDTASSAHSDDDDLAFCQLPTSVLAREANDILLVEVLSARPYRPSVAAGMATVRVIKTLKNGRKTPSGTTLEFTSFPMAVRSASGSTSVLVKGERYFFLYNHPESNSIKTWLALRPCHVFPDTPTNAAEVENGIALDPSNGEPYDYLNEP